MVAGTINMNFVDLCNQNVSSYIYSKTYKSHFMNRTNSLFCKILLGLILLFPTFKSHAQHPRVAIINVSDTTLFHKHLGVTPLTNKMDTLDLHFDCTQYVNRELTRYLSPGHRVIFITTPDTLLSKNKSLNGAMGLKKKVKTWLASLKDKYEFVIYIQTDPSGGGLKGAGGLFTHGNPIKMQVSTFSTISFTAFSTSNQEIMEYFPGLESDNFPIKAYKFTKDIMTIDPEMIPYLKSELMKHLDYKIENFLTDTSLVPKEVFDKIKLSKTE